MIELPPFRVGDQVRLSAEGILRVRGMPEAWGLHTAHSRREPGEVIEVCEACDEVCEVCEGGEVIDAPGDPSPRISVEFPSGAAYGWEACCFELLEPEPEH